VEGLPENDAQFGGNEEIAFADEQK